MAAGLEEGGELHTIEVEDELEELAQSFFDRSPHGAKIRLHIGSALDIAPALGMEFDLVFIDGDKREYPDYYRMLMGDGRAPPPWFTAARCWSRTTSSGRARSCSP